MMLYNYSALDGTVQQLDLDTIYEVVLGFSKLRPSWTATIVFDPKRKIFVELRSSPQDYRGNSEEEAEEVSDKYVRDSFALNTVQVTKLRHNPQQWIILNNR